MTIFSNHFDESFFIFLGFSQPSCKFQIMTRPQFCGILQCGHCLDVDGRGVSFNFEGTLVIYLLRRFMILIIHGHGR